MIPALIILALLAVALAWHFFLYKLSGRPWWNPLWMAFTITAVAILYAAAGFIGYALPYHNPFITHDAWAGHVVWSRVAFGCGMGLVSILFWRLGLQRL